MVDKQWWQILVHGDAEMITSVSSFKEGIEGTETIDENHVKLNIFASEQDVLSLYEDFNSQFKAESPHFIEEKNWIQNCEEIFNPLIINNITIIPIRAANEKFEVSNLNPIWIIPGMGFGTGHHATTKMLTALLQEVDINTPSTIIDIGTGSGILALVVEKLFPHAEILALDNDEAAIQNAIENQSLNLPSKINFETLNASEITLNKKYTLVLANLYAEALIELSSLISELSSLYLFISGIMESKWENVKKEFSNHGFTLHTMKAEDGWIAAVLIR